MSKLTRGPPPPYARQPSLPRGTTAHQRSGGWQASWAIAPGARRHPEGTAVRSGGRSHRRGIGTLETISRSDLAAPSGHQHRRRHVVVATRPLIPDFAGSSAACPHAANIEDLTTGCDPRCCHMEMPDSVTTVERGSRDERAAYAMLAAMAVPNVGMAAWGGADTAHARRRRGRARRALAGAASARSGPGIADGCRADSARRLNRGETTVSES
jgi:hypothetical protein